MNEIYRSLLASMGIHATITSMSMITASFVSSFMLGTSAEVIPLDEVQDVLDSGVVAQSRSVDDWRC